MKNIELNIFKKIFYKIFSPIFIFNGLTSNASYLANKQISKIGILLQWGIGDSLIAYTLIQGAIEKYPKAEIYLIGKEHNREIYSTLNQRLKFQILIPPWTSKDKKYAFFSTAYLNYFKKLVDLRNKNFNLILSPRFDPRDLIQLKIINPSYSFAYSDNGTMQFRITYEKFLKKNSYLLNYKMSKTLFQGGDNFFFEPHNKKILLSFLSGFKLKLKKYIVFHGGSSDIFKSICLNCNINFLCDIFRNYNVVIIKDNSYNYKAFHERFISQRINTTLVEVSLAQLNLIIKFSKFVVCADSSPLHFAFINKVSFLCFFVNHSQKNKWMPVDKRVSGYSFLMHQRNCKNTNINNCKIDFKSSLHKPAIIKRIRKEVYANFF